MNLRLSVSAFVLALLAAGCSNRVTVRGTVTLDGKPLPGIGAIVFIPEEAGLRPAQSSILNGEFIMNTSHRKGVMRGKYKVVIMKPDKATGKDLPAIYSSSQKTTLTYEVPKGGSKEVHFELNSRGTLPSEAVQ